MDKLEGTTNCLGGKGDFMESQTRDLGPEGHMGRLQIQEGTGHAQRETACAKIRWSERDRCHPREERLGATVGKGPVVGILRTGRGRKGKIQV